jgi:hypothetical protein
MSFMEMFFIFTSGDSPLDRALKVVAGAGTAGMIVLCVLMALLTA